MVSYQIISTCIFRIFLPLLLMLCCSMRFSLSSFAYFILLLLIPILPNPSITSMKAHTGRYLKAVMAISVINFLLQLVFQIVLLSLPPYGYFLEKCSWEEKVLRHFGLVRFDLITEEDGTRWILPDCLMLLFGPGIYIVCTKLVRNQAAIDALNIEAITTKKKNSYAQIAMRVIHTIGTYIALILLGLAGIMVPSITSSVYFFVFLGGATYWSLNNNLGRRFGLICRGLSILAVVHVTFLYIYQLQSVQEMWPPGSTSARIFGMTSLQEVRCTKDPRTFYLATREWTRFVNPAVLVILYYFLVFEVKYLLSNKGEVNANKSTSTVRYLIRRTTVRKRSSKYNKEKRKESNITDNYLASGSSVMSLTSPFVSQFRKGSLISAQSAPVNKGNENGAIIIGRRQSVFSDVSPHFHSGYRQSYYHPPQFKHLISHQGHRNFSHMHATKFSYTHKSDTSWPKHYRSSSIVSSVLKTAHSYSMEQSLIPLHSENEFKVTPADSDGPLSPFLSVHTNSDTPTDTQGLAIQSATSSHRSSFRSKNVFSFMNSSSFSRQSSKSASYAGHSLEGRSRRGASFRSVQVRDTGTIKEEKEDIPGGKLYERKEKFDISDENTLQRLITPLITMFQLLIRSSYIATNIVMMAWSITYHSWLTFVLLLWACLLWMIPNQRAAMLRCSPFLVIYAEFLLVLQYIYCLDLTDEELPREVDTVNLGQVGLLKVRYLPITPLIAKILYTSMFWITLRQHVKELLETQTEMNAATVLQPFTVAVTTTPSGPLVTKDTLPTTSPVIEKFGQWLKNFLVKFWIWLVAVNLFAFGIHGSEVVIFRMMYMVFFLVFLITFQLSYSAWRKFLYWFWIVVIIYQMIVLVLTYTYQFDHFPEYWENYTGIPSQLQNDIGLEVYDTGRLFIKLMTPTFFVIVTIIQVHYFHKDFLDLSDIENISPEEIKPDEKKMEETVVEMKFPNLLERCTLQEIQCIIYIILQKVSRILGHAFATASEFTWKFLELHIVKIVLASVMMLACYEVCVFHFIFALLASVAMLCPPHIQTGICRACIVLTSLLLIVRMIYQIQYINEYGIATNCSDEYPNYTKPMYPIEDEAANTAVWLGLHKAKSLTKYLKGYIGIIVVITIQAVVVIRQEYIRLVKGSYGPSANVLFPNVTRIEADDGLSQCIKFLFNYGFYKFGVEICLIGLVGVIGTRLDVYSLYYAVWLCYFFTKKRPDIHRVWKGFVISIVILIPIQYLMCIGMPPTVCVDYPWYHLPELREWLFFPSFIKPPESYKIGTDFCLLVCAVCQLRAFEMEFGIDSEIYDGGSNREIVYDDLSTLVNPIPDFVTYTRTSLDKLKVIIFFPSYWLTLSVMFLTGTNRTTLFAMGYVLGSFVFLWQGNEFYLKPLSYILKLWNMLLGYNVMVIVVKAFLQLLGCAFIDHLANNACWFVQLFGIACVKKFGDDSDDEIVAKYAKVCAVPKTEAGLVWDGICFAALLLQRRLFSSFYFQHLVTEIKAQTALASRGADLIFELMQKELIEQQAAEKEVLNKIKEKMEQIKATQRKMSQPDVNGHYDANTLEQFSNTSSPLPLELSTALTIPTTAGDRGISPRSGTRLSTTPAAPTPSSGNMTMSLDGYMDPSRVSLTTPYMIGQQLITSPSEDSFPVFSPPPYHSIRHRPMGQRTVSQPAEGDIGPPWLKDHIQEQIEKHRPSETSVSPSMSHHACKY